jgi:SET domain-containing protein
MTDVATPKRKEQENPYRVGRAHTGLGLFATEEFKKRAFIIEYTGRLISNERAAYLDSRRANKYLFELNSRWTIDGSTRRNLARYVNHSCKPNAEAELERGRMVFRACKRIKPGDEITIDYGEEYLEFYFGKHGCLCEGCRDHGKRKARKKAKKKR